MRMLSSALALMVAVAAPAYANDVGRAFPSEKRIVVDKVTGAKLQLLTNTPAGDAKLYQTHPQWAKDGKHIIFRSAKRSADGNSQAFIVNEATGQIVQLTDGPDVMTGSLNVARRTNELYYVRRTPNQAPQMFAVDIDAVVRMAATGQKGVGKYERLVATLPIDFKDSGGWTLDANEDYAYFGIARGDAPPPRPQNVPGPGPRVVPVPGGVRSLNLKTGEWLKIVDTEFRMGHVQANPWVPGEILYCWETGGDAPQRMWIVNRDGTGNRPLSPENPDDWVTHEVFIDKDHVMFNLMGHTAKLRQHPSGLVVVSLRDGTMENLGQTLWADGRSFWHADGTPNGKLALADDFNGTMWLMDRTSGQRTALSRGHFMKPDHMHGNFSPDGKRILVESGMLSKGEKLDLMTIPLPAWAVKAAVNPPGVTPKN